MIFFSLLFYLSTYLLVGTEAALDAEGIVGGDEVTDSRFSYQIALQKSNGHTICGGSIIGDQHILTAAHCVTEEDGVFTNCTLRVAAGVFDLVHKGTDAITIDVEKAYIPKQYVNDIQPSDIAVLKLREPLNLEFNRRLRKLELPEAGGSYAGVKATVTGFGWDWTEELISPFTGKLTRYGDNLSKKMKFAIADVMSNEQCKNVWRHWRIHENQICAKMRQRFNTSEGVCKGDSGGPLVYNDSVVIGVVSRGRKDCDESIAPQIYTRVTAFLDFIKNAMADRKTSNMRVHKYPRLLITCT